MKRYSLNQRNTSPARLPRGFTMVELLVVMAIIVFLVSITVAVVGSALTTARDKATKATIRKIDGLLTDRMEAFTMGLKAQNLTGSDRQTVIRKKTLFKAGFPQTPQEAGIDTPNTPSDADSSEALYEFLTNGESFGAPSLDSDAFSSSEVADTDGDDRMEFVDGWGRPLRFYRWPTRLIRPAPAGSESTAQSHDTTNGYTYKPTGKLHPSGIEGYTAKLFFGSLPSELHKDPDDPVGTLNPNSITDIATFETDFHTPETWSLPLIVSAGQDGVLGLFEPTDKGNFGHLAQPRMSDPSQLEGLLDNLSNRSMQP